MGQVPHTLTELISRLPEAGLVPVPDPIGLIWRIDGASFNCHFHDARRALASYCMLVCEEIAEAYGKHRRLVYREQLAKNDQCYKADEFDMWCQAQDAMYRLSQDFREWSSQP